MKDYSTNREFETIFSEAFNHITQHTITQVLTDFRAFEFNPDVTYDFFGLCHRALKANKRIFFGCPYIEGILGAWYTGIGIEHKDAIKTHTQFILSLI